jgi:FMN phosphatase YigB (HAD superfamily)
LHAALTELGGMTIELLTLDVFDTLLWRSVAEPADAFILVGRAAADRGLLARPVSPELFARLRIEAEDRARGRLWEADRVPECDISGIYAEMRQLVADGHDPEELAELEVDIESQLVSINPDVGALVRASNAVGLRVALVSDTYLRAGHLAVLLQGAGLDVSALSAVFVSCEHGRNKGTGIWESVLQRFQVTPTSCVHVGDNAVSDGTAPAEHGITPIVLPRRDDAFTEVLELEQLEPGQRPLGRHVDHELGDFGLTVLRGEAALAVDVSETHHWYRRYGSSVLGPALAGFAEWVVDQARALDVDEVRCLLREGELLADLVHVSATAMSRNVRALPVWASRAAAARAGLVDASPDELETFVRRRTPPTTGVVCTSLGLDADDVPALRDRWQERLVSDAAIEAVIDALSQATVRARILDRAARVRRHLVAHITRDAPAGRPLVLVDLGWGGSIQWFLEQALRLEGAEHDVIGLYLLTNEAAAQRMLDGMDARGYLADAGAPERTSRWTCRLPEVLEQATSNDLGSLVDFADDGSPVLGPPLESPSMQAQRAAVQQGIRDFQQLWYRATPRARGREVPVTAAAEGQARILLRSMLRPTDEEIVRLASWTHDEGFGSALVEPLIERSLADRLRHMSVEQLVELPSAEGYWSFGAARLHAPTLHAHALAVVDGHVPPVPPEATVPVTLQLDAGGEYLAGPDVDVAAGPTGGRLADVSLEAPAATRLVLDVGDRAGVVRVDRLRVDIDAAAGRRSVELLGVDAASALVVYTGVALGPGLLATRSGRLRLVYALPEELRVEGLLRVLLSFAWLDAEADPVTATRSDLVRRLVTHRAENRAKNLATLARRKLRSAVDPDV